LSSSGAEATCLLLGLAFRSANNKTTLQLSIERRSSSMESTNVRNGFLNFGSVSVLKKIRGFGFVTATDLFYMEGRIGRFIDFKHDNNNELPCVLYMENATEVNRV